MTAVAERLDGTETQEIQLRHVARYEKAIEWVGRKGGKWLDAACGNGYGTVMMPADKAVGVDYHMESVLEARRKHDRPRYGSRFSFYPLDLTRPWILNETAPYDVVLSIETIEHLPKEAQGTWIAIAGRLLCDGGVFVCTVPIGDGPNPLNEWHLHEPTHDEMIENLRGQFGKVECRSEWVDMTTGERQENAMYRCVK